MNGSDNAAGDLHLATVVVNVQDMRRAVAFWCAALSYRPRETATRDRTMTAHRQLPGLPAPGCTRSHPCAGRMGSQQWLPELAVTPDR